MTFDKFVKLPGSDRKPMAGAKKAAAADPNAVMQATLVLRPRQDESEPLENIVERGDRLTREEYQARYGADPADVQTLLAFASTYGLALVRVDLGARTVTLTGKTGDFSKAFQTELAHYEHAGGSYRGRTGAVSVPEELSGIVQSVHGLDNRPQAKPHFRIAKSGARAGIAAAAAPTSYTALQIAKAYNFPTGVTGKGQTIGIIELGGGFTSSDLVTYFKNLNISPAPAVVAVSVDNGQTPLPAMSTAPTPRSCSTSKWPARSLRARISLSTLRRTPTPDSSMP